MKKTYKIRVSKGDGKPVDDFISAKNGAEAHDLAYRKHPGSRNIHILGIDGHIPAVDHPFFLEAPVQTPVTIQVKEEEQIPDREAQIAKCLSLRTMGFSHRSIAESVKIAKSTVSRWLQLYG